MFGDDLDELDILRAIQTLVIFEIRKYHNPPVNESIFINLLNDYLFKFFDNVYVYSEYKSDSNEIYIGVKFKGVIVHGSELEYTLFFLPKDDISKWSINKI